MDQATAKEIIAANPRLCYQTLNSKYVFDTPAAGDELAAARPNCGYDCNEVPGCPYSGKVEP